MEVIPELLVFLSWCHHLKLYKCLAIFFYDFECFSLGGSFLHTNIRFAVFGPGRAVMREFIAQLFGLGKFESVPNLFFKDGNRILYS